MILLKDIFDALAFGELSGISLGSTGEIDEDDYPQIISHINMGLTALYKRFNLKQQELILYQQEDVSLYYLHADRVGALADMDDTVYILYNENNPFEDDLLKVLAIYDEDEDLVPLNNRNNDDSVFTPSPDILKMTPEDPVEYRTITYQANHPKIVITDSFDPDRYELEAPEFLKEALLLYVAGRVFRSKKRGTDKGPSEASTFMIEYETACMKLQVFGLIPEDDESTSSFANNGWA